jgi:hypothetical protein
MQRRLSRYSSIGGRGRVGKVTSGREMLRIRSSSLKISLEATIKVGS